MLRTFVRQGAVYLAGSLISRAINFLVLPVYARVLLPAELGVYELVTVFSAVAGIFIALEITQGLARYFHEAQTDEDRRRYASSAFWFTSIAYTLFIFICAAASEPISRWLLTDTVHAETFRFGLMACWANGLAYFALNQLRWKLQARRYALASVSQVAVSQLTALGLILGLNYGASGLFLGSFLGGVTGLAVALFYSRTDYRFILDWRLVREMVCFSLPLAASGLAVLVMAQVDRLVIKELTGIAEVGLYGVAARFSAVASILLIGFQAALTPLVTSARNDANTPAHLATIFRYFVASALPIVLVLAVFSREFIGLLAGSAYVSVHRIVPILAFAGLLAGTYVFAPGLWLAKRTKTTLLINVTSALLSTFVAVLLVSRFGLVGAALASLIGAGAHFSMTFWVGQRYFRTPVPWGRILLALLICGVFGFIGTDGWISVVHTLIGKLLFAGVGILLILWPLVKFSELKRIPSAFWGAR